MRLILIRHAETDGNKRSFVGRQDLPLNATGHAQVAELAKALAPLPIDIVLASPLRRAVQTAGPIASARGQAVVTERSFIEIDYGSLAGDTKGAKPFKLRREYRDVPMPGGESLRDVWRRLEIGAAMLGDLLARGAKPAIVGHYWSNRLLAAMLGGATFDEALRIRDFKPANASAYALDLAHFGGQPRAARPTLLHQPAATGTAGLNDPALLPTDHPHFPAA